MRLFQKSLKDFKNIIQGNFIYDVCVKVLRTFKKL